MTVKLTASPQPNLSNAESGEWKRIALDGIRFLRKPSEFLRPWVPGIKPRSSDLWKIKQTLHADASLLFSSFHSEPKFLFSLGMNLHQTSNLPQDVLNLPAKSPAERFASSCTTPVQSDILRDHLLEVAREIDAQILKCLDSGIGTDKLIHKSAFSPRNLALIDTPQWGQVSVGYLENLPKDHPCRNWDQDFLYHSNGKKSILLGPPDFKFVDAQASKRTTTHARISQIKREQEDPRLDPDLYKRNAITLQKLEFNIPPRPRYVQEQEREPKPWCVEVSEAIEALKAPHHFLTNPPSGALFEDLLQVRQALSPQNATDDAPVSLALHLSDLSTAGTRRAELSDLAHELLLRTDRELSQRIEKALLWSLEQSEDENDSSKRK